MHLVDLEEIEAYQLQLSPKISKVMKKFLLLLFITCCFITSNAEGPRSSRKANSNYKSLRMYVKILDRYGRGDLYIAQIDIINTSKYSVSFIESVSNYSSIFGFTAGGILFISEEDQYYYENNLSIIPPRRVVYKKVRILPGARYSLKVKFYITNRELFLRTNKNLRVIFCFNDANLEFMEDESRPSIESENIIRYQW